jgi:hypothetical protein
MHFLTKLTNRLVVAWISAAGLVALPEFTYAASFNQNLGIWPVLPASSAALLEAPPVVVGPVGALLPVAEPQPQIEAQAKRKAPLPAPAAEPVPSGADIVNKMLSPGPSDPSVPLPRQDLPQGNAAAPPSAIGPRIFGRGEEGGGVLGLRVPFPADRNATGANTRYGSGGAGPESARETR